MLSGRYILRKKTVNAVSLKTNKHCRDTYADLWFESAAFPAYGVHFITENEFGGAIREFFTEKSPSCSYADCEPA